MSLLLSIVVFILFMAGFYFISNMTLDDLAVDLESAMNPQLDIRTRAKRKQKNKQANFIVRMLGETQTVLTAMGKSERFILIVVVSVVMAIVGVFLCLFLGNPYLIPAMVLGFAALPFIFVRIYSYAYQRHLRNELELTLSQVTTSYLRTDNILEAVEENLDGMESPVREAFSEFVIQVRMVNPNMRQAVDDLKGKINNHIFWEWCECLKRCIANHTLKYMLVPVVDKFQTLREISGSIQEALNGFRIEFYAILLVVYINYPLIWLLNKEWYAVLETTTQGLMCTGFIAMVSVICAIILSFILKPLDYDI